MFTKKRTCSEKGCRFCEFCENDVRFPWVEFVYFLKNSLIFHEKHTFSEKGCHFREFCEKDVRFPRVEFVDFRKIATAPRENKKIDSGVVQEDQPP